MDDSVVSILCTALKIHRDDIVRDVQEDVIEALFDKRVLTENEYELFVSLVSVGKQNMHFIAPLNDFDFISVICVFFLNANSS